MQGVGGTTPAPSQGNFRMPADYVLGPGDQILVRSLEMEELNERVFVIDGDGNIALPLVGILHVAGLTADAVVLC